MLIVFVGLCSRNNGSKKLNLGRQDQKGDNGKKLCLGPYVIRGVTKRGTYLLSTTVGIILKKCYQRCKFEGVEM